MNKRKLIIIGISIVFLILFAIILAIFFINKNRSNKRIEQPQTEINITEFKNLINEKKDNYDTIWLAYDVEYEDNGKCSIAAKIPLFIGENETIKIINEEINSIFIKKLYEVFNDSQVYTIFNVDYVAYENEDMISLMIQCDLKSGGNPQRKIIKTYNYNKQEERIVSIDEILNDKKINKEDVRNELLEQVKQKNDKNKVINEQGYNIYIRDITSEIYKLENMTEFYINKNNNLYIIYAYGNQNNTNETDILVY